MFRRKRYRLKLLSRDLLLGDRTLIMAVLNVTPDSFSDAGLHVDPDAAIARAFEIERHGADILDIGAESTRPGSEGTSAHEELRRLLPVLENLRGKLKIPISVDTSKSQVAEAAAAAGAEIVNDVTGLRNDPRLAEIVRRRKLGLVLMHMRGTPKTMQKGPFARDVLRDVTTGLRQSIATARRAGIAKSQIIIDPGIGFGKSYPQNYELLARLPDFARLGYPLLVGTSRKAFISRATGTTVASAPALTTPTPTAPALTIPSLTTNDRAWGTAATVAASILAGAHIVRVHDVAEMLQVARVTDAILNPKSIPARGESPTQGESQ